MDGGPRLAADVAAGLDPRSRHMCYFRECATSVPAEFVRQTCHLWRSQQKLHVHGSGAFGGA